MNASPQFAYRGGELFIEDLALSSIAKRFGTPAYVYSRRALLDSYRAYADCLQPRIDRREALICYAVKANSNLAILDVFARAGAGFDIVSGGELERVLAIGGDPQKVIFSGVGKTQGEIARALEVGIGCFNVESLSELEQLSNVAGAIGKTAFISIRINPEVDPRTHPYIATGLKESKFGIAHADARTAYRTAASLPQLSVIGVDCHIGSQLLDDGPLLDALEKLIDLVDQLESDGIPIAHLDLGGGIGIAYGDEHDPHAAIVIADYMHRVFTRIDAWRASRHDGRPIKVLFEPGRSLVGNAGVLLATTLVLKPGATKNFAVVDAAMNDLIRPALYDAWHEVVPVVETSAATESTWDLVGPICESGDWLARDRKLKLAEGDVVAFLSTGAYGMTMASNYNTRPRAIELLVDGEKIHVIRERESIASLFAGERVIA